MVELAGVCKRTPAIAQVEAALRLLRPQRKASAVGEDCGAVLGVQELAALTLRLGTHGMVASSRQAGTRGGHSCVVLANRQPMADCYCMQSHSVEGGNYEVTCVCGGCGAAGDKILSMHCKALASRGTHDAVSGHEPAAMPAAATRTR